MLIIDLYSFVMQIPQVFAKLTTSEGIPSGHVYSFCKKLLSVKKHITYDKIVFVTDKGHFHRDKIYNGYKANRNKDSGIEVLVEHTIDIIKCTPSTLYYSKGYEADDCIFTLVCNSNKNHSVFSKDWDQSYLLDFNCDLYFTATTPIVLLDVISKFQCIPRFVPLVKAIMGDMSDNIPPIKGLRKNKYLPVNNMNDARNAIAYVKSKGKIKELYRNWHLVIPRECNLKKIIGKPSLKKLQCQLDKFEIKSISAQEILDAFCV